MIKSFVKPIAFTVLFSVLLSCQENKTDETEIKDKSDSTEVISENLESDDVSFTLPSSLQVATIFKRSGLKYQAELCNPVSNAIKYNTSNYQRAINLGVYTSDLAYAILNKQYDAGKNYLKTCKEMASEMGLNRAFEADHLMERFNKNMDQEDSLLKIVADIQLQSDILLEENGQKQISALAFTGGWIECMYIAAKVYTVNKDKNLHVSLVEQFTIADKISSALLACEKKEAQSKILRDELEVIIALFKNSESVKKELARGEDADYANVKLTDQEFNSIAEKIFELRQKIVN